MAKEPKSTAPADTVIDSDKVQSWIINNRERAKELLAGNDDFLTAVVAEMK